MPNESVEPTLAEAKAIAEFLRAAKALPSTLCVTLHDYTPGEDNLVIYKRQGPGLARGVGSLRKKSLEL